MLDIHALTAVLVAGYGRDDLGGHGTCHLKALGRFDHLAVDGSAVVQHILDIDQTTVEDRLDEIIRIMEMQHTVVVAMAICSGRSRRLVTSRDTSPAI